MLVDTCYSLAVVLFYKKWNQGHTYSAVIFLELAQPKENPQKMTQERTKIFFLPYMSLILEMQTANPIKFVRTES